MKSSLPYYWKIHTHTHLHTVNLILIVLHYSPGPFGINVHLCHLSERGQSVLHSVLSSIHFFLLVTLCLWWNAVVLRARFSRVSEKVGHADLVSPSWFRWLKQEVPRSPLWLNMSGKCLYGLASEKKKRKRKLPFPDWTHLHIFHFLGVLLCLCSIFTNAFYGQLGLTGLTLEMHTLLT